MSSDRAWWDKSDGNETSQNKILAAVADSTWVAQQSLSKLCPSAEAQRSLLQLALNRLPASMDNARQAPLDTGEPGAFVHCVAAETVRPIST